MRHVCAILIVALLALASCAASGPSDDGVRVNLTRDGSFACSGVRIAPDVLLTAAHCGLSLSLDGAALLEVGALEGKDIRMFECAPGPWTPVAPYAYEENVEAHLQDGTVRAQPIGIGNTWLAFNRPCRAGDSGSPVTTARGVVAIVTRRDGRGHSVCYADLIEGIEI
jgi:hypothetical protein